MPKVRLQGRQAETTGPAHHMPFRWRVLGASQAMFLESEEFAVDQALAAGSLSPLPEPCGVGGETDWFIPRTVGGIESAPRALSLAPFTQRPKPTYMT